MKKLLFLLLFVTGILTCAFAQTDTYYYYKGKKVNLTVNNKLCYVLMTDSTALEKRSLSMALENVKPVKQAENGYWTMAAVSGQKAKTADVVKAELLSNPQIKYVGPVFGEENPIAVSNTFCVKLKSIDDYPALLSLTKDNGCEMMGEVPYMPLWYTIQTPINSNGVNMSNRFYETGLLEKVDPLFFFEFEANCASDNLFGQQWGLQSSTGDGDINICQAWGITQGSPNITVAVFDTGIDPTHNEFAGNLLPYSYDVVTGSTAVVSSNHGTFVAGIIGANQNGNQISGVAPDTKLLSISWPIGASNAQMALGINWAVQNGAHIINNSWGVNNPLPTSLGSEILEEAIDNAINNGRNGLGCIVVFPSGNYGASTPFYPGNYRKEILCVGAVDRNSVRSIFSNFGTELDVVAPGSDILSTTLNNQTAFDGGTSFAAPHVSGVAALMLAIKPVLTGKQVRDIIEQTAQKVKEYTRTNPNTGYVEQINHTNVVGRPNGTWDRHVGYGLVDAYAALKAVQFMDQTPTIEGPSQVTDFGAEYTISGLPNGAKVVWSIGTGLTTENTVGATLSVKPTSTVSSCVITAAVTNAGITRTVQKTVSVLGPFSISGVNLICYSGSATYTFQNVPSGATVTWEASEGIYPSSGSGRSFTIHSYTGNEIPSAIIATIRMGNKSAIFCKDVKTYGWQPEIATANLNPMGGEPVYATLVEGVEGSEYYWYINDQLLDVTMSPEIYSYDWPCGESLFTVVAAYGGCEVSASADFWGMCGGGRYAVYPNPAGNRLTVNQKSETLAVQRAAVNTTTQKAVTRKVRLFNVSYQLVREQDFDKQSELTLDVAGLPNGIYFLNIFENGKVIEQQTVIVKH